MKNKIFQKTLALLLTLALCLSMAPMAALADAAPVTVSVDFTAQGVGVFLCAPQQGVSVSSDLAESYGYTDRVTGKVSALDVLVKAHEVIFGDDFTKDAQTYLTVGNTVSNTGWITKVFGVGDDESGFGFTVNGAALHDGKLVDMPGVPGGKSYTAYLIDQAEISSGDALEFFLYQDDSALDNYPIFTQNGTTPITGLAGEPGSSQLLIIAGYSYGWYGSIPMAALLQAGQIKPLEDAQLAWVDRSSGVLTPISGAIIGADGKVSVTLPATAGTYYLTAFMSEEDIEDDATPVILSLLPVTVAAKPSSITVVYDGTQKTPDGQKLVGKDGDIFRFKALDQDGNETPVTWSCSATGFDQAAGVYVGTYLSSGITFLNITATSKLDTSVKCVNTRFQVTGYAISAYQKEQTVALAADGQTAQTATVSGGVSGNTVWDYQDALDSGLVTLNSDPGMNTSLKLNLLYPGTVQVGFKLDFDKTMTMTDKATIHITGVAVEDADGARTKTYLTKTTAQPQPTVQLTGHVAPGCTVASWSSADDQIATVDETGLVTAKGVGSTIITATDSEGGKGGIMVVVQDGETPYFENLQFLASAFKNYNTVYQFSPTTLEYTLAFSSYSTSQLTVQNTTLYDTQKYTATATYTDFDGVARSEPVSSGAITYLTNMAFGDTGITITIAGKADPTNKTEYLIHLTRPRDTTKNIKSSGIVLVPDGRALLAAKYNGQAEGVMFKADENGDPTSGTGVTSTQYYYRTYALENLEKFSLSLSASTDYAHLRYSADDGATWDEVTQGSGTTGLIAFPAGGVAKVLVQILDDKTYAENVQAGKAGFAEGTPTAYTVWVERVNASAADAQILTAEAEGDWYPAFRKEVSTYNIVVPNGTAAGTLTYTVSDGAEVYLGKTNYNAGTKQEPGADGKYTLALKTSAQTLTVIAEGGGIENTYSFKLQAKSKYDVPDKVVDYLCMGSQYTNGGTGLQPEVTLSGTAKSLGNFGGYITYYYATPLTDDPKNKYGVDFYVYGNAYKDTSTSTGTSFFEPAQIYVSEDGSTWYALAGSAHYDDGVKWDYSVTYTKTASGKAAWTDNMGNSNNGASYTGAYPIAANYPMFPNYGDSITLSGIMLPASDGSIAVSGRAVDAYPVRWGYADCFQNGTLGADVNPYQDNNTRDYAINGFDLKWAVDAAGNPVDVSGKEFHYVKAVTASNIWHPSFFEKSPEIGYVIRTAPQGSAVGVTDAPTGVTISDGAATKVVNFAEGQQVYTVDLGDMKYVSVSVNGAANDDNIYVNNVRIAADGAAAGIKVTKEAGTRLVRVIVQNGEKEPLLYLLKLKSSATESSDLIEGVKVNVNGTARVATTTDGAVYKTQVGYRIDAVGIVPVAAGDVEITVDGAALESSYSLSEGVNEFAIVGKKGDVTSTVTLRITKEAAPVVTGTAKVNFTLLGDTQHDDSETHTLKKGGLTTWIAKTAVEVDLPATALDVIDKALRAAGYPYVNADGNYISSINGLAEFTNGDLSGWLYTLNGAYPNKGVAEQSVQNGDSIVMHYTDDYTVEHASDAWNGGGGGSSEEEEPEEKPAEATVVEIKPEAAVTGGEATAEVTGSQISAALAEAAKDENTAAIVIAPEVTGEAEKVTVNLPKSAVSNVADNSDLAVTVSSDIADVTLPNQALTELAKESGSRVTVSAEKAEDGAVKVDVSVDGKPVEELDGGLTVSVPAERADDSKVLVLVDEDGSETIIKKSTADGKTVAGIVDGSCTVKVVDNTKTFTDTGNHWGKSAIAFASSHELFQGVSATQFAPNAPMTRGMLATVLYRLEDAEAEGNNAFTDVSEGRYYTEAVTWANESEIVTGYGNGIFKPERNITREQLATMLYRYAEQLGMKTAVRGNLSKFSDAGKISNYAKDALSWAVGAGIIGGRGSGILEPKGNATRAEVAVVVQRLVKQMVK